MFSYPFRFPYPHQRGRTSQLAAVVRGQHRISHRLAAALALVAGSVAVALFAASAAHAALIGTGACNTATLSEPFARWGDTNSYELAAQGDFEHAPSQWTLSGGAARVAGSEPFGATGSVGSSSLALPAGSAAQSPFTCVNASYPTFRLFARGDALLSTVAVEVVYKTILGTAALPLGVIAPGGTWQPTASMLTGSLVGALLSGGTAQAALHFQSLTGDTQIDDVYIDPRMR